MSCIILSDKHLNTILNYMVKRVKSDNERVVYIRGEKTISINLNTDGGKKQFLNILAEANEKAWYERYPQEERPDEFIGPNLMDLPKVSPVEMAKACSCYSYQASDWSGYYTSMAYALVCYCMECATQDFEGWENAPWWIE